MLRGADALLALLDEHNTAVGALQFSPNRGPFAERLDALTAALGVAGETLEAWLKVQRSWLYLQPIFDSPDIQKQLPSEAKRFGGVDKAWRGVMAAARGAAPTRCWRC